MTIRPTRPTPGMPGDIRRETYELFKSLPSDAICFEIEREGDPQLTFSQEALASLHDELFLFLGARIDAYRQRSDRGAHHVLINLSVDFVEKS